MAAVIPELPAIPDELSDNWRQWWPSDAAAVADDVRTRLGEAVSAWGLDELQLLSGGNVAFVLAARRAGVDVVVKVNPRIEPAGVAGEGSALARWARAGIAPAVHDLRDSGHTLLLDRVRPGTSLADAGARAEEILNVVGALCPRLHETVPAGAFPSLRDYAAGEGWLATLAGTRELGELAALLAPGDGDRLLHTDLHWLNVLRSGGRWVVIDPKPHVGDPHAETFAFFAGPPIREVPETRPAAREYVLALAGRYARAAGLDADRLLVWIRLRAVAILGEPAVPPTSWGQRLSRLADALG